MLTIADLCADYMFVNTTSLRMFDVIDEDSTVNYALQIPGVKKDDLSVSLEESSVFVSWKKKNCNSTKEEKFYQQFSVPKFCSTQDIVAKLEDGILTITFKKHGRNRTEIKVE